jgi:hypothetical protein
MDAYRINPVGSGNGFKVHGTGQRGGLRIMGIFLTRTDAGTWIEAERSGPGRPSPVPLGMRRRKHKKPPPRGAARAFRCGRLDQTE